jgi:hypothetical protein
MHVVKATAAIAPKPLRATLPSIITIILIHSEMPVLYTGSKVTHRAFIRELLVQTARATLRLGLAYLSDASGGKKFSFREDHFPALVFTKCHWSTTLKSFPYPSVG